MGKILIFGNSGSGKSTLARELCASGGGAHLDLDVLAWEPVVPPVRRPLSDSAKEIMAFVEAEDEWVIEGCYADLMEVVADYATEIIFMYLSVEDCIQNAKARPWEPHKYASREEQDASLDFLLDWIRDYASRTDEFSEAAHVAFYQAFKGQKTIYLDNDRTSTTTRPARKP